VRPEPRAKGQEKTSIQATQANEIEAQDWYEQDIMVGEQGFDNIAMSGAIKLYLPYEQAQRFSPLLLSTFSRIRDRDEAPVQNHTEAATFRLREYDELAPTKTECNPPVSRPPTSELRCKKEKNIETAQHWRRGSRAFNPTATSKR
jgi:hypothetical protein